MVYTAGLAAMELCVFWLYQPYMQLTGLPIGYFGVAATLFNLVAAGSAYFAQPIQQRIGARGILIAMPVVLCITVWSMSRTLSPFSFLWIIGLQWIRGVRIPILHKHFLERAAPDQKATAISMVSLLSRLVFLVLSPGVGWLADTLGIPSTLKLFGFGSVAFFAILALWYRMEMPVRAPVPS